MSPEGYSDSFYKGPAYALVIGISKYEHGQEKGIELASNEFPHLNLAAKDAEDFVNFLKHNGFIEYNVEPLYNGQATLTKIKSEFDKLRLKCKECKESGTQDPLVIVYFSGHGWVDADNRHYLIPYDAQRDDLYATALWNKHFRDYLEALETSRLVVFLDACRSGGIGTERAKGVSPPYDFHRDLGDGTGRYIIASCKPEQYSWELEKNSIFTGHLLELLDGETDAFDIFEKDEIDLFNLYTVLRDKVKSTAQEKLKQVQEPIADIAGGTGIVIAINKRRKRIRIKKEEEQQIRQKRHKFLAIICATIDEQRAKQGIIIKLKLSDYVEKDKKDNGYDDFYSVFDYYVAELQEVDFESLIADCCDMLFSAYDRAFASRRSLKESRSQGPAGTETSAAEPSRTSDKFEDVGKEKKLLCSEDIVTQRLQPLPRDQQEPRRQLSIDARDYILEEITGKASDYYTETLMLRKILSQPLSEADFNKKVLDIAELKDSDKNLQDILVRILARFKERWAEPLADEPKKLSDFLMEKR
jgi:hypothetical protein